MFSIYLQNFHYYLISQLFQKWQKTNYTLDISSYLQQRHYHQFSNHMDYYFGAIKSSRIQFLTIFFSFQTNKSSFSHIFYPFSSKNSHNFHFHKHNFHIFEFIQLWIVKNAFFCSYLGLGRWKRVETSFTLEKVTIYKVFVTFQICVAIVDYFLCLCICVDLRCGLLVNAHVSLAIDQNNFFCKEDFPRSLHVYFWKQKQKIR